MSCNDNGYDDDNDNDNEEDNDEDLGVLHIQMVVYCLRHQHSQRWTNRLSLVLTPSLYTCILHNVSLNIIIILM